jgi:hypothetical protein
MKVEKILCMNVAAQLAGAVVANLPDDTKLDPNIADANLRAENLMAWELFRIFYAASAKALDDEQNWPSPKATLDVSGILEGAVGALLPQGLQGLPASLAPIIKELIGKLTDRGNSQPPIPGPIPNPGEARSAA